jgi:hypothetical protein
MALRVAMKYIVIDSRDLSVHLRNDKRKKGLTIPVSEFYGLEYNHALYHMAHWVVYGIFQAEDRKKGEPKRAYFLGTPDPWLVAIGAIMLEGIIQGLAWDSIKMAVQKGLEVLHKKHMSPAPTHSIKTRRNMTRREAGFRWTQFRGGTKQHEFFLGIKSDYEEMSTEEIEALKRTKGNSTQPMRKQKQRG